MRSVEVGRLRLQGGWFRHGRRWKVWGQIGNGVVLDVGLGRFWIVLGRFSFNADRTPYHPQAGWERSEEVESYRRFALEWKWRK